MIREATSVITHNPWGEYGHEEHVLVHRVATALARSGRKAVWYDNYVSTWSKDLMRVHFDKSELPIIRREVDCAAMQDIAEIYRAHDAWTWFDDYEWFNEEHFVRGPLGRLNRSGSDCIFPINLLHLEDR